MVDEMVVSMVVLKVDEMVVMLDAVSVDEKVVKWVVWMAEW